MADAAAALARAAWEQGQRALAAGDQATARRWLDRAHRLAPEDATIRLALATALLAAEPALALGHFANLAERHDARAVWLGLAVAAERLGDLHQARTALSALLNRHAAPADDGWMALAERIAPGHWRAVDRDLRQIRPDRPLADLAPMRAVEGAVEWANGALAGWAWHPGNPDSPAVLTIRPARGRAMLVVAEAAVPEPVSPALLARPRGFRMPVDAARGPFAVLGPDGAHLAGSPVDPRAMGRVMTVAGPPAGVPRRRGLAIVVPVYGNAASTLACLHAVLAGRPRGALVIVVDDASPEPDLRQALHRLAAAGRITLLRHAANQGFPASANAGIAAAQGRDVLLLNSDTVLPALAAARLHDLAYAAADTATVCPLSDNATILTYRAPEPGLNLAEMAWRANGTRTVRIPTPVGFCMMIRHDAHLAAGKVAGPLRADVFGRGYGEENDLGERLAQAGWRHVAAVGVFVPHAGEGSFGARAETHRRTGAALLDRLHPGYRARVAAHVAADPLHAARRRLDLAFWRARGVGAHRAAVLVTHAQGGGVERVVAARAAALRAEGVRAIVLRPASGGVRVEDGATYGDLIFRLPQQWPGLLRLLRAARVGWAEIHHLLGHAAEIWALPAHLGIPHDVMAHDSSWFCPRLVLSDGAGRYCGEPALAGCKACIARHGSRMAPEVRVVGLRAQAGVLLRGARAVRVATADGAARLRRHFPGLRPVVAPLEAPLEALVAAAPIRTRRAGRVAVVGALGREKGFDVLLAVARHAAARDLPLEFVLVGHSIDDAALLATGKVFVTGPYQPAEAVGLIRAAEAAVGFLPSIVPETWCHTLSETWQAGLDVVAFDIGAQAERIRAAGRGKLLPLGLAPGAVARRLLVLAG